MSAGDNGTIFRGTAFYQITSSGAINIFPATGESVTIDGTTYASKADLTGEGGVLVSSQVPDLSITSVDTVADQAARLALDVEEGDVAIQQDNETTYIFTGGDPTNDADWSAIQFDAVAAIAGQPIAPSSVDSGSYDLDGSTFAQSVAASGQVTLSSGEATVDTGVSAVDATFTLALGVDDPNADVDLSGRLFWDDTAGTYKIQIVEATTSVGNPTANYDVVRVR